MRATEMKFHKTMIIRAKLISIAIHACICSAIKTYQLNISSASSSFETVDTPGRYIWLAAQSGSMNKVYAESCDYGQFSAWQQGNWKLFCQWKVSRSYMTMPDDGVYRSLQYVFGALCQVICGHHPHALLTRIENSLSSMASEVKGFSWS